MHSFLHDWGALIARVAIAALFIIGGLGMLLGFSGTAAFLGSLSPLPGTLMAVLAIAIKLGGGLALAFGYKVREAAWLLIAFTLAAVLLAHMNWSDQNQMTQALKNLSIAGGLLLVATYGAGPRGFGAHRHHEAEHPHSAM